MRLLRPVEKHVGSLRVFLPETFALAMLWHSDEPKFVYL